ncbi:hypothetical protein [Streptomyces sp. FZ201]|uniref:hypothetical protein n=1 Tax=Streptomyces sp. FZ201 TaxID=3057122 RepID=UPI0033996ADE
MPDPPVAPGLPEAAAKVVDRALGPADERPTPVPRADIARRLDDEDTAAGMLEWAAAVPLTPDTLRRLEEPGER